MATLKSQMEALLAYANGVTGESDSKLGDAVRTLADGYGQGDNSGGNDTLKALLERNIKVIDIPTGTLKLGDYVFYACPITSLLVPEGVTSIGTNCFSYSSIKFLDLPSTLSSLGSGMLNRCTVTIKIKSITPPSIGTSVFNGATIQAIYVPDESVDTYKAATNWSAKASVIKPMSEYVES